MNSPLGTSTPSADSVGQSSKEHTGMPESVSAQIELCETLTSLYVPPGIAAYVPYKSVPQQLNVSDSVMPHD
jgi:hypothetical protein